MELKASINKLSTTRKKDGDHVTVGLAITLELQAPDADERGDISEAIDTGQQLYVSNILCQATGLRMRKTKEDSVTQVMLETKPTTAGIGHLYDLMAYGLLVTISEAQGRLPMGETDHVYMHGAAPPDAFDQVVKQELDAHGIKYQENVKIDATTGEILTSNWSMAPNGEIEIETPVNNTTPIETETPSELQIGPDWLQPGKPVRIKANGDFKGLTGTVVDVWDTDTVQVRGDDGVLIGAVFGERHLEAVE